MNSYNVKVNGKTYIISLQKLEISKLHDNYAGAENSAQLTLEAIKGEYEHCIARAEKLDNKITIFLAVYVLLFSSYANSVLQINSIQKSLSINLVCGLIIYLIVLLLLGGLYIYLLYKIIELLKGSKIKRLDPQDLMSSDVFSKPEKIGARAISIIYLDALSNNNKILEDKFKNYNNYCKLLIPIAFLTVIVVLFNVFL